MSEHFSANLLHQDYLVTARQANPHTGGVPRNNGLPTNADIGDKGDPRWKLHADKISAISMEAALKMAKGTKYEKDAELAFALLVTPGTVEGVPVADPKDSKVDLTPDQFQQMLDNGYYEEKPGDAAILGVVRVFLHAEGHKDPPRFRVIHWTFTVNKAENGTTIRLCTVADARNSVHQGNFAYSVDVKSCFNQFPIGEGVRNYYCLFYGGKWYRLKRLPMGQRQACFIAHTVLQVVLEPLECPTQPYIDNVHGISDDKDALFRDLATLRERAGLINMVFNENLTEPEKLVSEVVDFLGLTLDHRRKTCKIVPKTIHKLQFSWNNFKNWTVRQFCSHVSILLYCWYATGQRMGHWQRVLSAWARVQSQVQRNEFSYDRSFAGPGTGPLPIDAFSKGALKLLGEWTEAALLNEPVAVPKEADLPDFLLVTDASGFGWAAILVSMKTGLYTVAQGVWPESLKPFVKHSSYSEPIGLLAGVRAFFDPNVKLRVAHFGDNKGTVGQVNKGFSTKSSQHVMEILAKEFPRLRIDSNYYPGELIPADEPSRNLPLNQEKMQRFVDHVALSQATHDAVLPFNVSNSGSFSVTPAKHVGSDRELSFPNSTAISN